MSDYTVLLDRLRAGMIDSGAAVWQTPELDEALRQALTDLGLAAGSSYSLGGLDGVLVTTLPPEHFGTLVRGAAGYALLWRAVERLDAFNSRPNLTHDALAAAAALLTRFESALRVLTDIRTTALHLSTSAPYPVEGDSAQPGWQLPVDPINGGG